LQKYGMSDCCLTPSKHFVIYILARQYGNMLLLHTHIYIYSNYLISGIYWYWKSLKSRKGVHQIL